MFPRQKSDSCVLSVLSVFNYNITSWLKIAILSTISSRREKHLPVANDLPPRRQRGQDFAIESLSSPDTDGIASCRVFQFFFAVSKKQTTLIVT